MQAEFRAPRRRARTWEAYEAPLPVSGSTEDWTDLRAELINQHVLVCHPDHIKKIHNQGYFGKGILSRARPDHSISSKWEQHDGSVLPVVTKSRYEEMLNWRRAALAAQGLDNDAVSQILTELSQPVEMMDVKREAGPGEEAGVCTQTETLRLESPHRLNLNHSSDQDPHPDSDEDQEIVTDEDSRPNPDPLLPGAGFVLVCDNEDDECVREVRRTPLCMIEPLQLGLEEAFFLVYSLGCLSVYQNQEPLSIIQLWRTFRSLRPDFVSMYAAYHHFRSKGWVPKGGGGAKYGVDFMLYRKGPPFYHASYSVVVERVGDDFSGSVMHQFSWRSLAALNRITANVSKELMLCYIIHPADQSEDELNSPECLKRLTVQEVIINRWVSSRERAEQDDI